MQMKILELILFNHIQMSVHLPLSSFQKWSVYCLVYSMTIQRQNLFFSQIGETMLPSICLDSPRKMPSMEDYSWLHHRNIWIINRKGRITRLFVSSLFIVIPSHVDDDDLHEMWIVFEIQPRWVGDWEGSHSPLDVKRCQYPLVLVVPIL